MEINEAVNQAEKMLKFFKAFEKLEEVLNTLALSDQLIKERTTQVDSLTQEIQNLSNKKALMVKGFEADVYAARVHSEEAAKRYEDQSTLSKDRLRLLHENIVAEESKLTEEHSKSMRNRQTELDNLLSEIAIQSKLLESAKKALDAIKARLG